MSESILARITFGAITNDDLTVVPLGNNRYRLEDAPLIEDSVFYSDIIEAHLQEDGSLIFVKVIERSEMRHYDYILPRKTFESGGFDELLGRIVEAGGRWTQVFGGVPIESDLDVSQEIERLQNTR